MTNESQLRPEHSDMVGSYLAEVKNKQTTAYMLTISRDGESPVRTIIFYTNAIEAAEAYNKYTDWGFAKKYLTVRLYEPNGVIHEKILKRNQAGECTFIRQDYIEAQKILKKTQKYLPEEQYKNLIKDFAILFAKDSWRFDPDRFLKDAEVNDFIKE